MNKRNYPRKRKPMPTIAQTKKILAEAATMMRKENEMETLKPISFLDCLHDAITLGVPFFAKGWCVEGGEYYHAFGLEIDGDESLASLN